MIIKAARNIVTTCLLLVRVCIGHTAAANIMQILACHTMIKSSLIRRTTFEEPENILVRHLDGISCLER
jgi:hypothetical protein